MHTLNYNSSMIHDYKQRQNRITLNFSLKSEKKTPFEKVSCKKVFEPIPPTGNTFNKQGKRVLLQWRSIKSIIPRLFHN